MYTNSALANDMLNSSVSISDKVSYINSCYTPQTNGEISESIMQNWTLQAIECYQIKSQCTRCSLRAGNYSFVCQMPKIVRALLKVYGPPKDKI